MKKIFTSNYARNGKNPDAISISIAPPRWYSSLDHYPDLAPTPDMVKRYKSGEIDNQQYTDEYLALLEERNLDANRVVKDLDGRILLCYESPSDFCHRQIVAWWLEQNADVMVEELLTPKDKKGKFDIIPLVDPFFKM